MRYPAFTLIELIFVIVIIGVFSAVAIPKLTHLRENAKISAELSTTASVQTSVENCHGEWIVNDANFSCGADLSRDDLNTTTGYPSAEKLGSSKDSPLDRILKNASHIDWKRDASDSSKFYGPTYGGIDLPGFKENPNKPDGNDYWLYSEENGTFSLQKVN